ncbi:uncharacterized protein MONOS_14560 [Monocercomonoides exilis]|uniref:uncharacterized protein n=1 Tax=Monocercomonoides exilis TaxID=2049356 RepID=UPI00355962AA|nr:hypothetical protein MONOS_14560 [Monocercomonoides exilis]|eukprot:MONOS_14560.1-p1 / transcript=MONOS_14560.1 / gene=MONOS_14560 / organism=Monocercomonoides_exilis_PA203 / gene_product=unspecified product / transcript_product=unspecified product / location=Mono_scaffold01024:16002-16292(+) / protein_length=97 / sequence_SO=supercontig / SO=protein_coding / is_pseudo=false
MVLLVNTPASPNLLFPRIAHVIGSEKEEMEKEGEEEGNDMFDVQKDFCISEEESAVGDDGVNDFGGFPTTTEMTNNSVCGNGEKDGVTNVEEAVVF